MMFRLSALAAAAALTTTAHADPLTQWNFNSPAADANTSTGTTLPVLGTGSALLVGGTTATFASGDASGGSSDPATGDDSGWNTTTYAAQGTGNKTRGAQFNVSTVGFDHVVLSYDLRHSNTSSRYEQVQVTLDGVSFVDVALFGSDVTAGDTWYLHRTVDLGGLAGVANNASFGFRVVAAFAPDTAGYVASTNGSTYGTSGTWRFDMVTVNALPVPEPSTWALLLAGAAFVGGVARRRT